MTDSTTEGVSAEIARRHKVTPAKVGSWHRDGMPHDLEEAENWLKRKKRGNYKGVVSSNTKTPKINTSDNALDDILDAAIALGNAARDGIHGMYDRACAVEAACYRAAIAEPSAANVTAHARAQTSVVEAKKQVEAHELTCRNLMSMADIKRAIQAQDGCSVSLVTAMPYTLSALLVNQSQEAMVEILQNWVKDTYLAKRRETDPFREGAETVDIDAVIDEAEAEVKDE